jgi:glycosyltransferase involved in cell wall biosynthesis
MSDSVLHLVFWVACFAIAWTYFGYYVFLRVYSTVQSKPVKASDITPAVSIVVAVYNEEKRIVQKLENCLNLDYPAGQLEVIVVSDGSNDDTVDLVSSYADRGIKLDAFPVRQGKHYAQKRGIDEAAGEIIVFTDAATLLDKDAVRKIVRSFGDPTIGCVSGIDRIDASGRSAEGEGLYVRYEMTLRALESDVSSLLGVSGSFFAVRKTVCETWYSRLSSDFWISVAAYMAGFRTVLDQEAVGRYTLTKDTKQEFERKVRTVVHGLDVLFHFAAVLNPIRYGIYSFQMISHKLLRWLVPFLLILCFLLNLHLADRGFLYQMLLALQVLFYLGVLAACVNRGLQRNRLFGIPFFFAMANVSVLIAWFKYACGRRFVTWERTER